jgi:holo-[acyl-carrier protein] synthase
MPPESTGVKGIGIDITPINRISRLIERYDHQTLALLFTAREINSCQFTSNPHQAYAVCFATKEAVGKALGTGIADIEWTEIEANITHNKLTIHLYGKAMIQAKQQGVTNWLANWFSWDNHVMVHVLAL